MEYLPAPKPFVFLLCTTETPAAKSTALRGDFALDFDKKRGLFVRTPNLIYIEGDMTSCYLDPNKISADDLKAKVVDMGYGEDRVGKLHLKKPNVAFGQAFVPIENDEHEIELEKAVGCSEEAGSSGNGGAILDGLGDDDKDSDEIMSPNESEDDENERDKKIARREFPQFNEKLRRKDGTRNYSVDWLAETYIETFRIQPHMKPRVFKAMVDQRRPEEGEHSKKHFDSSGKVSRKGHKKNCSKCGVVGCTKTTCNKQADVNHRASNSSHAPSQLDRMIMIPTPQKNGNVLVHLDVIPKQPTTQVIQRPVHSNATPKQTTTQST
ncbi:hypothetical protein Cgig2_030792 [Carnegiea gigantea]|uniref:Uncharacterized protein n=1 Tax=Carnegiea gigantea TaxID=171969 RepID=A0A9Q1QPF9_9CARY|nr:hypothetical protein Cgig2_030792 [Carnegiea gigantea]